MILPLTCFLELFKSCIVIAVWRYRCLNDNFNDCLKRINVLWLFEKNEFCGWLFSRNCNVYWWFRGAFIDFRVLWIKSGLSSALTLPQLLEKVLETFPKFMWCKTASKFVCQMGRLLLWRQLGVHLRKVKWIKFTLNLMFCTLGILAAQRSKQPYDLSHSPRSVR